MTLGILGITDNHLSIITGLMQNARESHHRRACEAIAAKWNNGEMTAHGLYVACFNLELYWPHDELSLSFYINGHLIPWHMYRGDANHLDWHALAMRCVAGGKWASRPRLEICCTRIRDQMYFNQWMN